LGIGSFIFNFFGACSRWTYGQFRRMLVGGPKYTFREYLNGPDNGDEIIDTFGHGLITNIIGAITILIIIVLLKTYF
jgi:hypothetical protein